MFKAEESSRQTPAASEGVSSLILAGPHPALTNPSDPSPVDTAAGFHYSFACDGLDTTLATSYAAAGTAASTTCLFPDSGSYLVKGRIFDKDDGSTTYSATIVVNNVPVGHRKVGGSANGTNVVPTVYTQHLRAFLVVLLLA